MKREKIFGQAVVEYLIFLCIMAMISINLVKALQGFMSSNIGGLAVVLSRQLKTGVCESTCFFRAYKNNIE